MGVVLGVALMGALGSLCRWWLGATVQRALGVTFPIGTFLVNAIGATAIGVAMGFFIARGTESSGARVVVTVGFMGGFTTYSSFAFETWALFARRAYGLAALYMAATLVVCLGGCAVGVVVGRAVAGR